MTQRISVPSEFQVNAFTAGSQFGPSVTGLKDGGFVVTWTSHDQDGSDNGIFGQRVAAGAEFQINTYTPNGQRDPSVTALSDGGFVVMWDSFAQDRDRHPVGQRFDAAGAAVGAEFQFDSSITDNQFEPSVSALSDGGFVVTWQAHVPAGDPISSGVFGQRYDAAGALSGTEFQVSVDGNGEASEPSVTVLEGGGFVVTWKAYDSSGTGIYGQRYDAAGGATGADFLINTTTAEA